MREWGGAGEGDSLAGVVGAWIDDEEGDLRCELISYFVLFYFICVYLRSRSKNVYDKEVPNGPLPYITQILKFS